MVHGAGMVALLGESRCERLPSRGVVRLRGEGRARRRDALGIASSLFRLQRRLSALEASVARASADGPSVSSVPATVNCSAAAAASTALAQCPASSRVRAALGVGAGRAMCRRRTECRQRLFRLDPLRVERRGDHRHGSAARPRRDVRPTCNASPKTEERSRIAGVGGDEGLIFRDGLRELAPPRAYSRRAPCASARRSISEPPPAEEVVVLDLRPPEVVALGQHVRELDPHGAVPRACARASRDRA
jgi:hypothetical protein